MERAPQVLVVEDEPDVREAVSDVLRGEGLGVQACGDGVQALQLLRLRQPINLVVMDLTLPRLNGWELLERLQHDPTLRTIPVVVLSAVAPPGGMAGARRVLRKPVTLERLVRAVDDCLGLQVVSR